MTVCRFDPDPRSATAIRAGDPGWADAVGAGNLRDEVTGARIAGGEPKSRL